MATGGMPPMGRERRRKGPINRIRRLLYGLLLLAAAPGAAPADELAYIGKYRVQPPAATAPQYAANVILQGVLTLYVNPATAAPGIALDAVTVQLALPGDAAAPQFRIGAEPMDDGTGTTFELPVADFGSFRLGLLAQRSAELSGWSLGGTLELVRDLGERIVAAVPQLRVQELHAREARYLAFEAVLRRKPQQASQLDFRWRI